MEPLNNDKTQTSILEIRKPNRIKLQPESCQKLSIFLLITHWNRTQQFNHYQSPTGARVNTWEMMHEMLNS